MTYQFDTTTLKINRPEDFPELDKKYTLVRYVLPFDWSKRLGKNTYAALHVQLRQQLDAPYCAFQNDRIGKAKARVIYVLYPKPIEQNTIITLNFDFLNPTENPLPYTLINFHQLPLHIVIKLLQSKFSDSYPYFASNGKYYVHSQGDNDWHTCVEIQIHGALSNQDDNGNDLIEQEFLISGHAKYFVKSLKPTSELTANNKKYNAYYKIISHNNSFIFQQFKPSELDTYTGSYYYHYTSRHNKPHVDYHNQDSTSVDTSCRGYILFDFIQHFQAWLEECGIPSQKKYRNWKRYPIGKANKTLNLDLLATIFLYDSRCNKSKHQIDEYQKMLSKFMPDTNWVVLQDLSQANGAPTLALQDTNKPDYEEKGHLYGENDEYKRIKQAYPNVPTQFINVNPKQPKDATTRAGYLDYQLIELREITENDDKRTKRAIENLWTKFEVAVLQLYIKDVILNQRPVNKYLPVSDILEKPASFAYLRKENHWEDDVKVTYRVLLQVINNQLKFTRIEDQASWSGLNQVCEKFGYTWNDVEKKLLIKYCKSEHLDKDEDDLTSYDLIFMPKMVIEVEEMDETVLYKYDLIQSRLEEKTKKRPINDFMLLEHFDKIKPRGVNISLETLRYFGLLDEGARTPDEGSEREGVALCKQLEKYDKWLIDTFGNRRLSYDQLPSEFEDEVAEIFGWKSKKQNKLGVLFDYYKQIWNVGAATGDDVIIDRGIFYDTSDNAYRVAEVDGINKGSQDRAFLIRRFDVVYGESSHFDLSLMKPLLEAMSVEFVRYNRYTVYPYFFALLNTYINEFLR